MKKYLALLRGINVGGNKKVDMKQLKTCFEEMGFSDVITYINSGNVIFSSAHDDFSGMEQHLAETFGFSIPVLIRSAENLIHLVENIPNEWQNDNEQKTDILFLWDEYNSTESLDLIKTNPEVDHLIYIDGAIAWNTARDAYSKSGMNKFITSIIYKNMTSRNVNTVRKLMEMMR